MRVYSQTNSQALKPDEQVSFRLVELNRVPFWQASTGRTFPVIAGAEDPPPPDEHSDETDGATREDGSTGAQADPQIARLRSEAAETRVKLREATAALDALKAEDQKRKDAEKSEVERLRDQLAETERKREEAERQHKDAVVRQTVERAAAKAGAADPEDVYALLKPSDFDIDDDGVIKNADKLVDALLKAKPYLVASKGTNGVPATPRANGTRSREGEIKDMQDELRQSGRYNPL
jgi:chromosome segregation ATPase